MKTVRAFILTGFVLVVLAAAAGPASAHGTDHRTVDTGPAVAVEFTYVDGSPMNYAEVLVYSPGDDKIEHQNGRTDANGRFVFYPDEGGEWKIEANDGTGHLEKALVKVSSDPGKQQEGSARQNKGGQQTGFGGLARPWAALLGISLILNICLGFYFFKKTGGKA
ncbi:MAG: hypothetical protein R6U41_06210 [Desulfosalsimonas sp.]|uniref:hypothetical protein n=1 Tax=Desulfosalsimonas sp. TaxID=3073848 RepID=UPI003970ACF4